MSKIRQIKNIGNFLKKHESNHIRQKTGGKYEHKKEKFIKDNSNNRSNYDAVCNRCIRK